MEPGHRCQRHIGASHCALLGLLATLASPALAQDRPQGQERTVPEAPGAPPAPPGPRIPERIEPAPADPARPGTPAGPPDAVPPVDNVIRPPAGIDPNIHAPAPTPDPNTTPVIPPPAPMPRPQ